MKSWSRRFKDIDPVNVHPSLPCRIVWTLVLVLICAPLLPAQSPTSVPISVYFSPKGGCTEAVVNVLQGAKKLIRVQAYSFTSAPIAKALVDAHKRGVQVQVILDKSQRSEKYTSASFVSRAGIEVLIDDKHAIAHNKIMIVDDEVVITGSFNFTKAAEEKNAENLLIIRDRSFSSMALSLLAAG